MKSSKRIIIIETILLVCVVVLFFMQNKEQNNKIILNEKEESIVSANAISMLYETEVGSSSSSTTDTMKIGLMYVSDYGFAASNSNWITALSSYSYSSAKSTNWLAGLAEWTVSREPSNPARAFHVMSTGYVDYTYYGVTYSIAVRPSFYLVSSTTYVSGSGTSSNPFKIN